LKEKLFVETTVVRCWEFAWDLHNWEFYFFSHHRNLIEYSSSSNEIFTYDSTSCSYRYIKFQITFSTDSCMSGLTLLWWEKNYIFYFWKFYLSQAVRKKACGIILSVFKLAGEETGNLLGWSSPNEEKYQCWFLSLVWVQSDWRVLMHW